MSLLCIFVFLRKIQNIDINFFWICELNVITFTFTFNQMLSANLLIGKTFLHEFISFGIPWYANFNQLILKICTQK